MNVKIALQRPGIALDQLQRDPHDSKIIDIALGDDAPVRHLEVVLEGATYRLSPAGGTQYVARRGGLVVAERNGQSISVAPEVGNVVQVHAIGGMPR